VNHLDKEWRFQDLDLASVSATGKVKLRFELASDEGLQFGGWTLDDVCIVVPGVAPSPTCGNGQLDDGEQCDDGNTTDGDGCSAACQNETPGGGSGSGDDDGDGSKPGGGCCSTSGNPAGALALAALVLGLVLRRRYRAS
jgi:MYXO-CTERM domain-containing protein